MFINMQNKYCVVICIKYLIITITHRRNGKISQLRFLNTGFEKQCTRLIRALHDYFFSWIISRLYCDTTSVPGPISGKVVIQFNDSQIQAATSNEDFLYVVRSTNLFWQKIQKHNFIMWSPLPTVCLVFNVSFIGVNM